MTHSFTSNRTSKEVAYALMQEQDPKKLAALAEELNQLLIEEERQKVLQRLGRAPDTPRVKAS